MDATNLTYAIARRPGAAAPAGLAAVSEVESGDPNRHSSKRRPISFGQLPKVQILGITEYLTFSESACLTRVDRARFSLLDKNRFYHLMALSAKLATLGCNVLVQNVRDDDARIEALREGSRDLSYRPDQRYSAKDIGRRQKSCRKLLDAQWAQRAEHLKALQAIQDPVGAAVFHFAGERLAADKQRRVTRAVVQPDKSASALHRAIHDGDSELVRSGLREYFALPGVMTRGTSNQMHWPGESSGRRLIEFFAQHPGGALQDEEQRQLEAIYTWAREIASTPYLSPIEKHELCVGSAQDDLVQFCLDHRNPAVAAALVLGILESSATPQLKQRLLGRPVDDRKSGAVQDIITSIKLCRVREEEQGFQSAEAGTKLPNEWIEDVVDRLNKGART